MRKLELISKQNNMSIPTDTFATMAGVIGRRFRMNPQVVERWLEKKGYGVEDFNTIIDKTNDDFGHWFAEILECSKDVKQ